MKDTSYKILFDILMFQVSSRCSCKSSLYVGIMACTCC